MRIDANGPEGLLYLSLWEEGRLMLETNYETTTPWAKQFAQLLEEWMEEEESR